MLRDYQKNGLAAAKRARKNGKQNILMVAPTGAGKGTMIAHQAAALHKQGQGTLLLAHRREIVLDLADRVRELGVPAGVMLPDQPRSEALVQVASVQSVLAFPTGAFQHLIPDEAHHYVADEWRAVLARYGDALITGYSATPQRSDGRALGDVFDHLIDVVGYQELLSRRLLVPCRVLRPEQYLVSALAQEPYAAYLRYGEDRRTFMYVGTVAEAERQARYLSKRGVRVSVIHGKTDRYERADTLEALREGEIKVVVNVETMTEGIDVPEVSCVVLGRGCQFHGAYVQLTGRALRPCGGKKDALLLDLSGASYRHGHPTDDRVYSLHGKDPIALARLQGTDLELLRAAPSWRSRPRKYEILDLELGEYSETTQSVRGTRVIDWSSVGLGRESDSAIAKRLGLDNSTVGRARRERGIATYDPARALRNDPELGKVPDSVLATRHRVCMSTVCCARKKLGIPASRYSEIQSGRGDPVARKLRARNTKLQAVMKDPDLGKVLDRVLVERHAVSDGTVLRARQRLGIPAPRIALGIFHVSESKRRRAS